MMKTKQKTYRYRIKIIIKDNNIWHILRCIRMKDKTSRRYTFFVSNFARFRILLRFVFLIFTKIN